jgi:hypothetical protein
MSHLVLVIQGAFHKLERKRASQTRYSQAVMLHCSSVFITKKKPRFCLSKIGADHVISIIVPYDRKNLSVSFSLQN